MWNACRKGPGICLNNSNPCTEDETSIVVITTHQAQGNPENKSVYCQYQMQNRPVLDINQH